MDRAQGNRSRFVVKITNGIFDDERTVKETRGETTALKVFRFDDPLGFLADFSPVELDTLFAFDCPFLLSGRSIRPLTADTMERLAPPPRPSPPAPRGATSPRRSPSRTAPSKTSKSQPLVVLGVEVQMAESDIRSFLKDPTLPTPKIVEVICDLILGVHALHSNGRAHLDITPDNCLYANGRAMLADFGACALIADPRAFEFRRSPTTRAYAAPESIGAAVIGGVVEAPLQGEGLKRLGRVGMANDMWSLGATIYEIVTGVGFHRFLQQEELNRLLDYDDQDPSSVPEDAAAWVNWFVGRPESKSFPLYSPSGELLAAVPSRDANVLFFLKVLTGKISTETRVWDEGEAFELATLLAGLLELDVSKRLTSDELLRTPLVVKKTAGVGNFQPRPLKVDAKTTTKPARAIIRSLMRRLTTSDSEVAAMSTRQFFIFADILGRAFAADSKLGEVDKGELTLAAEIISAYLVAVPFDDPAENFPALALEWWEREAKREKGELASCVVRVIVRLLGVLKCRLYNPSVYETATDLAELAYLYPVIFFDPLEVDLATLLEKYRELGKTESDFVTDSPESDAKKVLLTDFISEVVRPEKKAIEKFYREAMDIQDLGAWLPENM